MTFTPMCVPRSTRCEAHHFSTPIPLGGASLITRRALAYRRSLQTQPARLGVLDLEIPLRRTRIDLIRDVHGRGRDIHDDGLCRWRVAPVQHIEHESRAVGREHATRCETDDVPLDAGDPFTHVL